MRLSPVLDVIREIAAGEAVQYASYKFVAGTAQRYRDAGVDWQRCIPKVPCRFRQSFFIKKSPYPCSPDSRVINSLSRLFSTVRLQDTRRLRGSANPRQPHMSQLSSLWTRGQP